MTKIDLTQHPPFIYPDYRSSRTRGPKKPLLKLCDIIEGEPHIQLGEFQGSLSNKFHIPESCSRHKLFLHQQYSGWWNSLLGHWGSWPQQIAHRLPWKKVWPVQWAWTSGQFRSRHRGSGTDQTRPVSRRRGNSIHKGRHNNRKVTFQRTLPEHGPGSSWSHSPFNIP